MSPREKHQRIIDQFSAWVIKDLMTKDRALELERRITEALPQGSNMVFESILWQVAKDEGIA